MRRQKKAKELKRRQKRPKEDKRGQKKAKEDTLMVLYIPRGTSSRIIRTGGPWEMPSSWTIH